MAEDLIQTALDKIGALDAESLRLKMWVNEADRMLGVEPRFGDLKSSAATTALGVPSKATKKWQPGAFFNKPFSTAVRAILAARFEAVGLDGAPASVDDIHDALSQGSFDFGTAGAESQKNSIRISLGKNSTVFVKLPNTDLFGLVEWWGKKPGKPGRRAATGETADAAETTPENETDTNAAVDTTTETSEKAAA